MRRPLSQLFNFLNIYSWGEGTFTLMQLIGSGIWALVFLIIGLAAFNKHGDRLIDVV